ncbi:MAG: GAF domain-containing protein [Candidatus Zixiibacteriota bacterium]
MIKENLFKILLEKVDSITGGVEDASSKLLSICRLLKNGLPGYDWVGYYIVSKDNDRELVLGPFAGDPTEHVRIPFGRGICGQAAETGKTFIVDDVTAENNYLACSINVKSEIVIPIFRDNKIIAELDIDSHTPSAFTEQDEEFLIEVGRLTERLI